MISLSHLAQQHRETTVSLAEKPTEFFLLWYADLALEVEDDERVGYRCTECSTRLTMYLDEFLQRDSNEDLRCEQCRGDLEERGGPMG